MRKFVIVFLATAALMMLAASAAGATQETADQLVRQLVKAHVCVNRQAVNATGTIVQCTNRSDPTIDVTIMVHAYPTRAKMLRSLEAERQAYCNGHLEGVRVTIPPQEQAQYLVGPNWWTPPFTGARQAAVLRAIGGKLRTYACS